MRNTCRERKFLRDCLTRVSESPGHLIHKAALSPDVITMKWSVDGTQICTPRKSGPVSC